MAAGDPVRIRRRNGEEFILQSVDAFDREAAELSQSETFMSFLAERAQEPGRTSLEAIERRLGQAGETMKDRP